MALYKCKLPILDPLLSVFVVVSSEQHNYQGNQSTGWHLESPENLSIQTLNKEKLPLEYQYFNMIGLELRKHSLRRFTDGRFECVTGIELLVGEKRLIFFEEDLEKVA